LTFSGSSSDFLLRRTTRRVMRSTRSKSEKQIRESKSEKASPRKQVREAISTPDVSEYRAVSLFCIAAETNVAATAAENVTTSWAVLNT
jgi:hypothetical protein